MKKKYHEIVLYIIIYSVIWFLCALLLYGIFRVNNKSFMWHVDGIYQHFVSFNNLCNYLKSAIKGGHELLPIYNYSLAQGADIITTLNSYDFTDPVSILAALVFPLSRPDRYTLMIFMKLYLIGAAFSFYCYAIGQKETFAVLSGAIAYSFSGAILFTLARHPNFINWAYFLPFLLAGIELYLRKGKKLPLVLFVFWNIITSYYTFYMDMVLAAIYVSVYALCNVAQTRTLASLWEEFKKGMRVAGVCWIGIFLSMFILLPTIHTYLINTRVMAASGYTASYLHYPLPYYAKLMDALWGANVSPGYYTYIGLNAAVMIPLILIFIKRKQDMGLKVLIAISFVMLCIPMAGRMMNGFGYACNRWSYAVPFYVSAAFVIVFGQIQTMTPKEKKAVFIVTMTYILCCLLHVKTNTNTQKYTALLMILWVTIVVYSTFSFRYYKQLMLGLTVAGACFQTYFFFSPSAGNYISEHCDRDKLVSVLKNYSSTAAPEPHEDFYRIEKEERRTNIAGYNQINGTEMYWSMMPSFVLDYHSNLALSTVTSNAEIQGLDGRTGLLELASVKYYTRPQKETGLVPYGYREIKSPDSKYQVFENQYSLPVGYTFSSYIPTAEYEKLNGIEKEQAMLQGVVLDTPLAGYTKTAVELTDRFVGYEISETNGIDLSNNSIKVKEANGTITLVSDIPEDCEIYLYLKNIHLLGNSSNISIRAIRECGTYSATKSASLTSLNYNWTIIRDDVAYNLGYGHPGKNTITLSFSAKATLSYDDIQVVAVPMSSYEAHAKKLQEYVLKDVCVADDRILGTITVPENRILQLSVPYSIGWKAYVDGQETEILKSDVMYMAIPLSGGTHTIELRYVTPYLKQGILLSVMTSALWGIYELLKQRRSKNEFRK